MTLEIQTANVWISIIAGIPGVATKTDVAVWSGFVATGVVAIINNIVTNVVIAKVQFPGFGSGLIIGLTVIHTVALSAVI